MEGRGKEGHRDGSSLRGEAHTHTYTLHMNQPLLEGPSKGNAYRRAGLPSHIDSSRTIHALGRPSNITSYFEHLDIEADDTERQGTCTSFAFPPPLLLLLLGAIMWPTKVVSKILPTLPTSSCHGHRTGHVPSPYTGPTGRQGHLSLTLRGEIGEKNSTCKKK